METVETPGVPPRAIDPDDPYSDLAPKIKVYPHHQIILSAVEQLVYDRKEVSVTIDGVMLFLPPGSAKTTYGTKLAAAWALGHRDNYNVIATSYGQTLTNGFSRDVRKIVSQPIYKEITGAQLTYGEAAVGEWSLSNGSRYFATSIGGSVTGKRGNLVIVDDPIKGRQDANSEVIRESTWVSLRDDFFTRVKPGEALKILMIMTRWHEDDPAGRILGEEWKGESGLWEGTDGRIWKIINCPMEAEHDDDPLRRKRGDLLWPEMENFTVKDVARYKKDPLTWNSLYQQRPAPAEGVILKTSSWRRWELTDPKTGEIALPKMECIFSSYDTAFTEDDLEDNSYSACTLWGVFYNEWDEHYHVMMIGAWRERVDFHDLVATVKRHYEQYIKRPGIEGRILVEKKASGISLCQELRRARLPVQPIEHAGPPGARGKVPRAHSAAYLLDERAVWYVDNDMTQAVIRECASFPFTKHDDWVDTVSQALIWMRKHWFFTSQVDDLDAEERRDKQEREWRQTRSKRRLYGGRLGKSYDPEDRRLY